MVSGVTSQYILFGVGNGIMRACENELDAGFGREEIVADTRCRWSVSRIESNNEV